jgi:hopanoid C-3 methylase HpnR
MYTEVYLRLEPLGVELAAASARRAGHDVRMLDLQTHDHADYFHLLETFKPEAVGFGVNYLANIPEVIDLAIETKRRAPGTFFYVGGHSASFTAVEIIAHAKGAIDCVIKGEAEEITPRVLEAARDGEAALRALPGVVTAGGVGPPPQLIKDLDALQPARDLLARRRKYFIGVLDPAASIEFSRGCQWDCSFCSAWTFYGRSHRRRDPRAVADELARIEEPGIFIVDDVAFVQAEHGYAIAGEIARRNIRKKFYLETRGDVLLRNLDVFKEWRRLGLEYMFLGVEAIDAAGLEAHRKRIKLSQNFEALEAARSLGLAVAVNIIADVDWDESRFQAVRDWALSVPEIVNVSVNTPYPGTETFLELGHTLSTRDYRLYDIQHAVMPTKLPLDRFYRELVKTQSVLNKKHLGLSALKDTAWLAAKLLARGQTNFVKMLWRFGSVFNPARQLADHAQPVKYAMTLPPPPAQGAERRPKDLYILRPPTRAARAAGGDIA